ncbi:threonine aspartase 1-like [Branchiostoma lanceolatum]|uniref:threonine aspartase 1-like n=1 Tax=Branchiostoma lanceolatum TaxID=7740 RepID=UPI003451E592
MSTDCPLGVVAVHLGAGYHSVRETPVYARACRAALREGVARLRAGCSAREAACAAVAALENDPCTNAGTGSNLTLGGDVECDAAVMDGQTRLFGAVGAVSSMRNPVLAAQALLEQQQAGPMTLGRVPPAVLVGRGAERWAQQYGIPGVDRKKLVTEKSAANYRRYMERLAAAEQRKRQKGRPDSLKRGATSQQGQGAGKRLCIGKGPQSQGVGNFLQGTTKKGELGQGQGDGNVLQETTKDVVHVLVQGQGDGNILQGATEEGGSFQGGGDGNFFCQNLGRKRGRNLLNNEIMSDVTGEAPTCGSSGNGIPNGAGRFDQEEQSLVNQEEQPLVNQSESAVQDRSDADIRLDTVGAVAMDMHGNVSAAVSSGGLALKQPGRLGHAAMYGCGCWAVQESPLSVACSTTGCGEHIMQTMLAKECAESILQGDETNASLDRALKSKFLHSPFLRNVDKKVGGAILLRCEEVRGESEPAVELLWGHTADSMCVGFMSTHHDRPQVRMSRLPAGQRSGQAVVTEGCFVR